jgi:DNA-binding GntR family transcriptional regulator
MATGKDNAYEELRRRLLGGHYSPGTQLKEAHLADELGLSRTPVRAALKKLVADGLATAEGTQGIRVAEWTSDEIDENYQIRIMLEPYVVRLAVERGGPGLATALHGWNQKMAEGISVGGPAGMAQVQDANQSFHRTLLDACRSPKLRAILHSAVSNPVVVRGLHLYSPEELNQSLHHHQDLTLAAEAGDAELAQQVMLLHLRMAYRRFTTRRAELLKGRSPD